MPIATASVLRADLVRAAQSVRVRNHCRELFTRSISALLLAYATFAGAVQIDIIGPAGSVAFGTSVTVLSNGNFVVTDPNAGVSNTGAVYLYSPSGVQISVLTGSTANDKVGSDGVIALSNGNFVISSHEWNKGAIARAGAITWGNAMTGVSGVVSTANSLVGTSSNDQIGESGVTALSNGNYVVASRLWDNGGIANTGAVTWGNGNTGVSGVVSASNSLVGSTFSDQVGANGGIGSITALKNGNYVVASRAWTNGAIAGVGAVTWGNGSTGTSGAVSASNSLVGTSAGDSVGSGGVTALSNGNYAVGSPSWKNGTVAAAGAATWGNGSGGTSGTISASNSLVGTMANDLVGDRGITALSNGNYVVASSNWKNGATARAGAATWGNGNTGTSGAVSVSNSLYGTSTNDVIAYYGITALTNGNYVVASIEWDNGAVVDAGAATWGNGSKGTSGPVSTSNSLVGASASDTVGRSVIALSNGNYVVASKDWDNGIVTDAGAATWGNGSTGTGGNVSAANSLVGTTVGDKVGSGFVTALTNGNYVVSSFQWSNVSVPGVGAATWGNGSTGTSGAISSANSLIGTMAGDQVGSGGFGAGVTALSNGNYVVGSHRWNKGAAARAGAATWGNGSTGTTGVVTTSNSLVGTTANDEIGSSGVIALSNGNYGVSSRLWDNGAVVDAGAITLALGSGVSSGALIASNSVRGTVASGGSTLVFGYDAVRNQLVVGRPASNIVTLFDDPLFRTGFE